MPPPDENAIEKKLRTASATLEGIQNLALWVFHYKQQHEKIVDVWFNILKKSKIEFRLVLYYLCNEIVQTCRRKHAVVYKDAFKEVLKDATLLVRDVSIKPNIERIYTIWGEREVYEKDFCDELLTLLNHSKSRSALNSKLLAEFQPVTLMEKIITQKRLEDEMELKRRQLVNLRLDASSVEAVKQLKDRTHGKEFCAEFESACKRLEEFVSGQEKEIQEHVTLVELLEQSELYYDGQYGEAKIVANAYRNFGNRVVSLAKKLNEKVPSLDDTPPSTPVDSPEYESPMAEPIKDMFDEGLSLPGLGGEVISGVKSGSQKDVTAAPGGAGREGRRSKEEDLEAVDMDMSDDDTDKGAAVQTDDNKGAITVVTSSYRSPIISSKESVQTADESEPYSPTPSDDSMADEAPMGSPLVDSGGAGKEALTTLLNVGAAASFMGSPQEVFKQIQTLAKPVYAEGGSTPVMDEDMTDEGEQQSSTDNKSNRANPIDFLTQLIGSNTKESVATTASPFIQSLSALTNTVKNKYTGEQSGAGDGYGSASWIPGSQPGSVGGMAVHSPVFPPPPMPPFMSSEVYQGQSFVSSSSTFLPPPPPPMPAPGAQAGYSNTAPPPPPAPLHVPHTPTAPGLPAGYRPPANIPSQTPTEVFPSQQPPPPPASQSSWPHAGQAGFSPPPQPPAYPPPPLNHQQSDPGEYLGRQGLLPPPPQPFFARPPGPPPGPPPNQPHSSPPQLMSGAPHASNGQEEFAEKLRRKTTAQANRTLMAVPMENHMEEDMEGAHEGLDEDEVGDDDEFFSYGPSGAGGSRPPPPFSRPPMYRPRFDRPFRIQRPNFPRDFPGKRPPPPPPFRPFRGGFPRRYPTHY